MMTESNLKRQINNYISEQLESSLTQFVESMGFEPNLKEAVKQRISIYEHVSKYRSDNMVYHILKLVTEKIDKKLEMINEADKQYNWQERLLSAPTVMILNDLKRELE